MLFNPDPPKQAVEVCFPHKNDKETDSLLKSNISNIQSANSHRFRLQMDFIEQ